MNKKIDAINHNHQIKETVHKYVAAIDANPQKLDNYLRLSTYLIEQGSVQQAQKLLEEAQHLVKKPLELNYNLAVCHYLQGNFDQAIALLKVIPNDDLALYQKALVYLKVGQGQKALAYALTIKNQDNKVHELIGDIWLSLGNLAEAEKQYLAVQPATSKIEFLLGVVQLSSNRQKAKAHFAISKQKDEQTYKQLRDQYAGLMEMISKREKNNG